MSYSSDQMAAFCKHYKDLDNLGSQCHDRITVYGYGGHEFEYWSRPVLPYKTWVERLSDLEFFSLAPAWHSFFHLATTQLEYIMKNPQWMAWVWGASRLAELSNAARSILIQGFCTWFRHWGWSLYEQPGFTELRVKRGKEALTKLWEEVRDEYKYGGKRPNGHLSMHDGAKVKKVLDYIGCLDQCIVKRGSDDVLTSAGYEFGVRLFRLGWVKRAGPSLLSAVFKQACQFSTAKLLTKAFAEIENSRLYKDRWSEPDIDACMELIEEKSHLYADSEGAKLAPGGDLLMAALMEIGPMVKEDLLIGGMLQEQEQRRLRRKKWPTSLSYTEGPRLSVGLCGGIYVHDLDTVRTNKKEIDAADICDDQGDLLLYDQAIERLREIYNDFDDESTFNQLIDELEDTELGQAFTEFYDSEFDRKKLVDYEVSDLQYDLFEKDDISFEEGICFSLTIGYEEFEVCCWKHENESLSSIDFANSMAVGRCFEAYEDYSGACWLNYRGLLVDGETPSLNPYDELTAGLARDFVDFCREAVRLDGWSHGIGYDFNGKTMDVRLGTSSFAFCWWKENEV